MQGFADNFLPVIPNGEDVYHTDEHPFCYDPMCLCHEDEGEIALLIYHVQEGHLTLQEATNIVAGKTV